MLKISAALTDNECRLFLEGALVGVGLEELRTMSNRLRAELDGRTLVVDIKDAAVISQEGENVLLQLINEGAKVRAHSVIARRVLQELARHSKKKELRDLDDATPRNEGPSQISRCTMTRSIVVTDASKGVGRAAADVSVQQSWSVIGLAHSSPGSFPGEFIQTDLSNLDETRVLANDLAARRNVLGIVNNVGIAKHEMIDAVELDVFTAVMDLNVRPALQLPSSIK